MRRQIFDVDAADDAVAHFAGLAFADALVDASAGAVDSGWSQDVLPVLATAFRDDLPALRLLGPFGAQTLIRCLVISEIPRRLKEKVAIDDPQTAILSRPNLKEQVDHS